MIQELTHGGAERVVLTLAERLRDVNVEIASADGPDHRVPLVGRRPDRLPRAAWALRGAIRMFRPDIVHAHNPGMAAITAMATARGWRPHALTTCHGVPDGDYAAAARTLRLAGLPIVACGPGVAAGLEEHGARVHATVLNGVSAAPAPIDRTALFDELGLDHALRLVVAVGRLTDQKHHDLAIAAMDHVPDAALVIVGDGPNRAALEARAGDRVRLMGARDDARAILGAADVAVLPSRWEGLPLVALEAAVGGVPLVATAARGVRELFRDGIEARVVQPDDAPALAAAIREVIDNASLARTISDGGRALASQHGEAQMVDAYRALYEEMA